jgi:hypothetical protein
MTDNRASGADGHGVAATVDSRLGQLRPDALLMKTAETLR